MAAAGIGRVPKDLDGTDHCPIRPVEDATPGVLRTLPVPLAPFVRRPDVILSTTLKDGT
jgi:hypothetical protein